MASHIHSLKPILYSILEYSQSAFRLLTQTREPVVPKTIHTRPYAAFKRSLRDARKATGVTQTELAARLSMTQSAVSKIEMGEQRIDVIQLREWCVALGITLADFVASLESALRAKSRSTRRV
jgi:ribosome-binding protein aMBF1 (putative translation factor)